MNYDVIVIGGGPGGYTAAIRASQKGLKTALIEKSELGGTCLNLGCIPTKSLLNSSKLYHKMQSSQEYGIETDKISYNIDQLYKQKDDTVKKLVDGIAQLIQANQIDYYHDQASFVDQHIIFLRDAKETIEGKNIVIATGSRPRMIAFEGNDLPNVLTSDNVMKDPVNARHIGILGGGVIGVELAEFYSDLGCTVSIIESQARILSTLDRELSVSLSAYLKKKGVFLYPNARLLKCEKKQEKLIIHYQENEDQQTLDCDAFIVAVGREANSDSLDLDKVEITTNHGFIPVNQSLQTIHPHIYAIGDVNGSIQLAHVASSQGKNCINHIVHKEIIEMEQLVPYCIYTGIEIAYVGLSEQEAKEKGLNTSSKKILMNTNGKHLIETEERSFMKVIIDQDHYILGAQLYCRQATELISYFTMAIQLKLKIEDLEKIVFPHPTISEAVSETFEHILGTAIHQIQKRR